METMNMEERIARINELYHRSKEQGLTAEEKEEQAKLRREYVDSIKKNLKSQLDNIVIERPDGSTVDLGQKYGEEKQGQVKYFRGQAGSMNKADIRRRVLALREALQEEERERARVLLTERILGHQWFYRADILLGFAGYGSEINTVEILEEALRLGKQVYLPRVTSGGTRPEMVFLQIHSTEELVPGYKGIPEPPEGGKAYGYSDEDTESVLMLMPGVAFDGMRRRVGYGKGFYDRYLADKPKLQLKTIGVGFRCQMVEEIPWEEYDIRPYQVICV